MSSHNGAPPKRPEIDFSETATLLVGPAAKRFLVYENLAIASSGLVKLALDRDWKESKEHTISLPEAQVDHVEVWLRWLYYETLDLYKLDEEGRKNHLPAQKHRHSTSQLTRLYCFGDYMDDIKFRDACTDELIRRFPETKKFTYTIEPIQLAWEKTLPGSSIRRLLLRIWCREAAWEYARAAVEEEAPSEFKEELCLELMARLGGSDSNYSAVEVGDMHKYHVLNSSTKEVEK